MTINWQQFGLKKDPYDTQPLVEGSDLSIEQAFIGRTKEREYLDNLFESSERLCLAICGNIGVGKTSLANIEKFVWKYQKEKLLFSFRREIEACDELLDKKSFLIEIIGSVIREIKLLQPDLLKTDILIKLDRLVDITQTIAFSAGIQAYGFGVDGGKENNVNYPQQVSTTLLEGYFNEIRDVLQTPNTFFLFLGPNDFYKKIINTQQRVKSIFAQSPLKISSLAKTEIVSALEERMKLLKSDDVASYIKPITDEVIFRLYDLYSGDIRSIMSAVKDIMSQCSERLVKPLDINEASVLLGREKWDRVETTMQLTQEQKEILKYLAASERFINQKEIGQLFNKARPNVSGYYFKPLKENNLIEEKEKIGRIPYYGLTVDYIPLKWLIESQRNIKSLSDTKHSQLSLEFRDL